MESYGSVIIVQLITIIATLFTLLQPILICLILFVILKLLKDNKINLFDKKNNKKNEEIVQRKNISETSAFEQQEDERLRILSIVNSVAANMEVEKILEDLMPTLIDITKSNCSVFYLANHATNKLEIKKSIGFSHNIYSEFDLTLGEGFIGKSALSKDINIISEIPDDTVYIIRTFLGTIKPKNMLILPVINQNSIVGVFAFASIHEYFIDQLEILNLIKYYVGAAIGNGITYEKTKRLTNELKFQNRLIQNLNDDLEKTVLDRTGFLNNIIDSLNETAIYATDKDGIVVLWNKGAERLYGTLAKEMLGNHIDAAYPEDEVEAGFLKNRFESVLRDGRYAENGWRFRKDGSNYYAEMIMFARHDLNGEVINITNITQDSTAIKNIESELYFEKQFSEKILESSSRALIVTDDEGFIQTVNKQAIELFGANLFVGECFFDYFEKSEQFKQDTDALIVSEETGEWAFKILNSDKMVNLDANVFVNELTYSRILFFYAVEQPN